MWVGRLRVVLGGDLSVEKKNREQWDIGFRWLLLDEGTQQPTKSRPKIWDIFLGDGAQGDDDRGGC